MTAREHRLAQYALTIALRALGEWSAERGNGFYFTWEGEWREIAVLEVDE